VAAGGVEPKPRPVCNGSVNGRKVAARVCIAVALAMTPTPVACDVTASDRTPSPAPPGERPKGAVENCSTRSMADFPGAYSDPHNVVVGPLVLVGAAHTPASTVREHGGNKFPLLVRAGHRVTVALSHETRRVAGLGYGPLPQREDLAPSDGHRVVTFKACRHGKNSGSNADGRPVTFWSGSVLTSSPRCVPLEVWVDDRPSPRHIKLRMGVRRCP
jgi:hypothetical protein